MIKTKTPNEFALGGRNDISFVFYRPGMNLYYQNRLIFTQVDSPA